MNFYSLNQSIICRRENAAMFRATEPGPDYGGETVDYVDDEFELVAFSGLSLGVWRVSFTATCNGSGWERGPVTLENLDRGGLIVVDLDAVRRSADAAARYDSLELCIIERVDAYLKQEWAEIEKWCDQQLAEG